METKPQGRAMVENSTPKEFLDYIRNSTFDYSSLSLWEIETLSSYLDPKRMMSKDQEQIKSKLDELIRRLEYFNRDYQNVPLQLAKDIRELVIDKTLAAGESDERIRH